MKKLITVLLIMMLVLTMFAGCGDKEVAAENNRIEWDGRENIITENIIYEEYIYEDVIAENVITWDDID